MQYRYQDVNYQIEYEVEDLADHLYNIYLIDDNGNELDFYDLPYPDQMSVYEIVDGDAIESAYSDAYDRAKDILKYGE